LDPNDYFIVRPGYDSHPDNNHPESSMKRILVATAIIAGIMFILFMNRARNQAKVQSTINLSSIPVTAVQPVKQKINENLSSVGTLYGIREVTILSETQGRVMAIHADMGDRLSEGSPIAKVDDELKVAALMSAEANYEKAQADYERYKKLIAEQTINESQLESAAQAYKLAKAQHIAAQRQLKDTKIASPISGIVTARYVEVGAVVVPGTPVITIADISTLKIKLNVPEKDVFKLRIDQDVDVLTEVYHDVIFKGKILHISDKSDDAHMYPIEIALPNSREHPLKSGLFARVVFHIVHETESILIPRNALVGSVRSPQVYVVENNMAKLRDVMVGMEIGNDLEITQGLTADEVIVTSGQINLKDNVPVTIAK
jgi:RND family efflux transporter MFP subunit